jgi:hypothetical protein
MIIVGSVILIIAVLYWRRQRRGRGVWFRLRLDKSPDK